MRDSADGAYAPRIRTSPHLVIGIPPSGPNMPSRQTQALLSLVLPLREAASLSRRTPGVCLERRLCLLLPRHLFGQALSQEPHLTDA